MDFQSRPSRFARLWLMPLPRLLQEGVHRVGEVLRRGVEERTALQYYAQSPVPGQQWGFRVNITPLLPE